MTTPTTTTLPKDVRTRLMKKHPFSCGKYQSKKLRDELFDSIAQELAQAKASWVAEAREQVEELRSNAYDLGEYYEVAINHVLDLPILKESNAE